MRICTEYTIVATDDSCDVRAAAEAGNRELLAAGDTFNLHAAEEKLAECAACLRDALKIEVADYEVWYVWLAGKKDAAGEFLVPLDGKAHDVADLGARTLGVDVSKQLNVKAA